MGKPYVLLACLFISLLFPSITRATYDERLAVWIRLADVERGMETVKANKHKIARVLVSDHCIAKDGLGLDYRKVQNGEALARTVTTWCRAENIPVFMGLGNYGGGFSHPEIIIHMLALSSRRKTHIEHILNQVVALQYDGVDLDYENLPATVRKPFTQFVRELNAALKARGKLLDVTVPPKFSSPGWDETQAFDWTVLPTVVNRVNVMCYDWHYRSGPPGPIIPLGVTKKVIRFIRRCPHPEKFWIGHPAYGNDWVKKKTGKYRGRYWGGKKLMQKAKTKGKTISYRSSAIGGFEVGPFAHYTYPASHGQHHVWFGDHKSLAATIPVVRKAGLGGVFIWRVGFEDPGIWDVIRIDSAGKTGTASSQPDGVSHPASLP